MKPRKMVAPLVVAAAVAGGGIAGAAIGIPGISGAQESPSTSTPDSTGTPDSTAKPDVSERKHPHLGAELEAAADALGMEPSELLDKLSDGETTIADVAEAEGVELSKVTDAMKEAAGERIDDMVNKPWPRLSHDGPGRGPRVGPWHGLFGRGVNLDAAAGALGLSADDLMAQLRDGKSIADIAEAQGIDLDAVVDAIVKHASEKLDALVEKGVLTQERADELKANLEERINELVNGNLPKMLERPLERLREWREGADDDAAKPAA
jgi:hypothetical protein